MEDTIGMGYVAAVYSICDPSQNLLKFQIRICYTQKGNYGNFTTLSIFNNSTTPLDPMKSMNVVRYKVKPEYKDEFIQAVTKWELQES
mgnify:CR=1 FL=1